MNPLECKACFEEYHATTRRPRALPCGHSYCEPCLGVLKNNQMIRCPTCRREHIVNDVTELMIVYDLIELLDGIKLKEVSSSSKKETKLETLKPGECEEHGCLLNFYCITHQVWICRDCTVLDHPKENCSIGTKKQILQEKLAKEKEKLIAEKEAQEECKSFLINHCEGVRKGIDNHQEFITKLQSVVQGHLHKKECLEKESHTVEQAITDIGAKNTELISMIPSISEVEDFKDLEMALIKSEELLDSAQNGREMLKKNYHGKADTSSVE